MLKTNSKSGRSNQTPASHCRFEQLESRQMFSAGGLDSTFGQSGVAYLSQLPHFSTTSTAIQPDGKTVLVGAVTANGSTNHLLEVSRLNGDGSIDKTFAANGVLATSYKLDTNYHAAAVAVQPDGKTVIVASEDMGTIVTQHIFGPATYTSDQQWLVIRLNNNGTLDQTFGVNGVSKIGTFEDGKSIGGVAIQSDGKIVFSSDVYNADNTQSDFETVRVLANGALDGTFGDPATSGRKGHVNTALGSFVSDVDALVIQSDGKIVVGGTVSDNAYDAIGLIRYNANGTLDTTFNNGGKIITHFSGDAVLKGVSEDAGDNLFAVGGDSASLGVGKDAPSTALIVCYNGNGQLTKGFGNGGVMQKISPAADADYANFVTFPQPGKILVAGSSAGNAAFEAQYSYNGLLDPTFGTRGIAKYAGVASMDAAAATVDGKVVLAGASEVLRTVDATPIVSIQGLQDGVAGGQDGEFTFTRDAVYNFPTRVYFQTSGSAQPLVDYTGQLAPSRSLKGHTILNPTLEYVDIPAGKSFVTVSAHLPGTIQQPTETLTVTPLSNPDYLVARDGSGTIELRNPTLRGMI